MSGTVISNGRKVVRCPKCGREQGVAAANEGGGVTLVEAQAIGWAVGADGKLYCPFCAGNEHMLKRVFDKRTD